MQAEPLAFPSSTETSRYLCDAQPGHGLALRIARESDLPYLRELYAASRAPELAAMPWPDAVKQAFCDSQFDLQHRHYVAHHAPAGYYVVMLENRQAGRLYLRQEADDLRIVDILIDDSQRGRGLGSTLLRWLQSVVHEQGLARLTLSVATHNPDARRLYERLGFVAGELAGMHLGMVWQR